MLRCENTHSKCAYVVIVSSRAIRRMPIVFSGSGSSMHTAKIPGKEMICTVPSRVKSLASRPNPRASKQREIQRSPQRVITDVTVMEP